MLDRAWMTRRRLETSLALAGFASLAAFAQPLRDSVHFEHDGALPPGQSPFVVGDVPELGGGDVTRAVKLAPSSGGVGPWIVDVALPQGVTYTWRLVARDAAITALSDPENGSDLTAPATDTTSLPTPPTIPRVVFAEAGSEWTRVTFHTLAGDVTRRFAPAPGLPELIGATLDNQPNDTRGILATIAPDRLIDTPLSTVYRRAAHHFNYVPAAGADLVPTVETFVVPTGAVPHTRVIDGVSGRGVRVWLPRGYFDHLDRRYPTLYMHDGQNVFSPGGPFGSWDADETAQRETRWARVRELILVAIDNSPQRSAEYVPELGNATVDNDDYNSFIVSELKPLIDARYRTRTGRNDTAVAGSSFGGIASLSLGLEHPMVFGHVGAFSTSFWVGATAARVSSGQLPAYVRLYLDAGDVSDGGEQTMQVRDALLRQGRILGHDLFFQIGYGHAHNEAAWSQRFPDALRFLYGILDEPNEIDLPAPLPGDLDADCDVDLADLALLLAAFGECEGQPGFAATADIDASGCVDLADLATQLANFGAACDP